jgi:hypothetical protein
MRKAYILSFAKHEGKRRLGKPRYRWEDNIKMGVKMGYDVVDWMHLAQNRAQW